jgi:hypothetical protein
MKYLILIIIFLFHFVVVIYSQPLLKWKNFTPLEGRAIKVSSYDNKELWIAGSGGLFQYNMVSNTWKSYTTAEGLSKIWCKSLYVSRDTIWVGTETGGANIFNIKNEQFYPFLQFPMSPHYPEYRPTVNAIYPENETVWVGADEGLYVVGRLTLDTLRRFTMADGLGENYVYSIVDDGQYLWFATAYGGGYYDDPPPTGGLSRFDKKTETIDNFTYGNGPGVNYFWDMEGGDTLWIAGNSGLLYFSKKTNTFGKVDDDFIRNAHSLKVDNDYIWCVGYSFDGNECLFKVNRLTTTVIDSVRLPYDYNQSDLAVDSSDVYIIKGNRFFRISKDSLQLSEITTPLISSMFCYGITSDNSTVYAGSQNILLIINKNNWSIINKKILEDGIYTIRSIRIDLNNVWISTDQGLLQYDRNSLTFIKSFLSSLTVYFTVADGRWIWAVTHLGLYKIDTITDQIIFKNLSTDLNTSYTPRVTSLVLNTGILWLSFNGIEIGGGLITGIAKLDPTTLECKQIRKFNLGGEIQTIESLIDDGDYLLAAGKVISKVDKDSLKFEPFLNQRVEKLFHKDSLLFAVIPQNGIKVFNLNTGQELLYINEANGLTHNWVTNLFIDDNFCWFSTYAGISGLELSSVTSVREDEKNKYEPKVFSLLQNYPNPFNPSTTIEYEISSPSFVALQIFNTLGQEIATIVNELKQPGKYVVSWDSNKFSSGVYYYRLIYGNSNSISGQQSVEVKKMIVIK